MFRRSMGVGVAVRPESGENACMTPHPELDSEDALDRLLADAWEGLLAAVPDGRHEWHVPVLSTIDDQGRPSARVVVLRDVQPESPDGPLLRCHTDRRSRKVQEMDGARAQAAWTFYERERKVQLRMVGRTVVHVDDDIADQAWAQSTVSSRRCYMAPHGPSDMLPGWDPNLPEAWMTSVPDLEASESGRINFAVLRTVVQEMERLELHHDGHIRSRWRWDGGDLVESCWLAP